MKLVHWLSTRLFPRERIEVSDEGVVHHLPSGHAEMLRWRALRRVEVLTIAAGPLAEDFFFVLSDDAGMSCTVPNGLSEGLFERLQKLPGFDFHAFIRATTSTQHKTFLCWEHGGAGPRYAATA